MDKFFQDPLAGDRLDINFLGQNPFSKTVLFIKWFFQDSFSYRNEMVTLSKEMDGFVSVSVAEYATVPPGWLTACQKGVWQALCASWVQVYRTSVLHNQNRSATEGSFLVILCEQKFSPVAASSDFMPRCWPVLVLQGAPLLPGCIRADTAPGNPEKHEL